jgi:hypothetical protein
VDEVGPAPKVPAAASLRLPSRWPTYALVIGSVVGIFAVVLAIPAVAGHSPGVGAAGRSTPTLTFGPLADHDPRPPPMFSGLPLVTSPAPPPGVPLVASDVGVTPTAITLGVILPSLGAIASFGIDVSALDPKTQETYWNSAVARVNAAGGVDGRRLDVVFATADILSADSQRAACQSLTEDHHVFAVANELGITGDPVLCVTRDHQTPFIGVDGEDPSYYPLSQGRLITLELPTTEVLTILVDRLAQLGLIRGHTIGVVHDTGPGGIDGGAFRSALLARGAKAVIDAPLGNEDPLVVSGQVAEAEQRMHQAGVDTVLLLTNAVYGTIFGTQADQDRYTPTYVVTDLGSATAGDSFIANQPASFFRQALAVTTAELGQGRSNLPEAPLDAGCRLAYQFLARRSIDRDGDDDVAALGACSIVQILTMGLNGAGPNPTRAAFVAALSGVGMFALPAFGRGYLAANRPGIADDVEVAAGHADCQCWYAVDGFRPISSVVGSGGP